MVQAILAGRKTQTRRVMKPQPTWVLNDGKPLCPTYPKYQPGDILYVRETWRHLGGFDSRPEYAVMTERDFVYKADEEWNGPWKPSLFMPKEAARIFLQVTDVRAQHLQDITKEDAIAEGIDSFRPIPGDGSPETLYYHYLKNKWGPSPLHSFQTLWDSINAKTSPWEKNDWVWVYTFKKIENPNQ